MIDVDYTNTGTYLYSRQLLLSICGVRSVEAAIEAMGVVSVRLRFSWWTYLALGVLHRRARKKAREVLEYYGIVGIVYRVY